MTTTVRKLTVHQTQALSVALEHETGFSIGETAATFAGSPRTAYDTVVRGLDHLATKHGPKAAPVRAVHVVRRRLLDAVLDIENGDPVDHRYVVVTP